MEEKNVLVGLWLDDSRHDPVKFLNKDDDSESGTVVRQWYNDNMNGTQIQWTAVSNFWQFKQYIETNGVPDFVSLDHDLGKDAATKARKNSGEYEPTGADCALFLVSYCLRSGIPIPKNYIHSANDNKRVYISKAFRLGRMGKDPMQGVDLDNEQEFAMAADRFRASIMNPNVNKNLKRFMKKNGDSELGTADRLARMRGINNPEDLFKKNKSAFRENNNKIHASIMMSKKLIRLTEGDLHKIVKESVKKIIKEFGSFDVNNWHNTEDMGGYTGKPKMFKLYDTGDWSVEEAEQQAREEGITLEELFKECLDGWEREGGLSKIFDFSWCSDSDFIGGSRDIFRYKNFVVKEWEEEIYFTEYPPQSL